MTEFLVEGADGRRVDMFTAKELHAFKLRIVHLVKHGGEDALDRRPLVSERLAPGIPAETFTITPLDADRKPMTDLAEEWSA